MDVYGDGSEKEAIFSYAKNINKKINFLGYNSDISNAIINKYTGIIGVGRVVLEGLAMNLPVILCGNGKICGVIDKSMYHSLKENNFVAKYFKETSILEINKQIKKINNKFTYNYKLRSAISRDFNIKNIVKKYFNEINNIDFYSQKNIEDLYNNIVKLIEFGDKDLPFYSSINVYYLLKNHVEYFSNNFSLKNMFICFDKINKLNIDNEIRKKNKEKSNEENKSN